MVLFTSSSFSQTNKYPEGVTQNSIQSSGTVSLSTSDGVINPVFDSVQTALNCLESMISKNQVYLQATDDIIIYNVSGTKLLIFETTFLNQKLLNSFSFVYSRGKVLAVHRNLSVMLSLTAALKSVGYKYTSTDMKHNFDLQDSLQKEQRPFIQVVDYKYVSAPVNSLQGSLLEDEDPIQYN